jgi:polyisoprenoid-binding protein YceI
MPRPIPRGVGRARSERAVNVRACWRIALLAGAEQDVPKRGCAARRTNEPRRKGAVVSALNDLAGRDRSGRGRSLVLLIAMLLVALAASVGVGLADEAPEDGGPSIHFIGKNSLVTAKGTFHSWRVTRAEIDVEKPEQSIVEIEVDIVSIDTGIKRRDNHLRSDDFFDIEKYPKARVRVTGARPDGKSEQGRALYRADFDVSIRDVSKTLEGQFEVVGTTPPTIEGSLVLNRMDFGVGDAHSRWNPMSVKEEIPLTFSAVLELNP